MGLTFGYELRLPASLSGDEVDAILEKLKRHAERSRFRQVSSTYAGVVDFLPDEWRQVFNVLAEVNAEVLGNDERPYVADLATARGFLASPGKGAETTSFGFMLRTFDDDGSREWFWQGWCKTQYASNHGDEHILRCHLRLVEMMDFAIQSGVEVTVWDEGQYWETRDRDVLLAELDKMNRLMARVAGRLHDAKHQVESPIFEHPDWERLEG